MSGRFRYLVSAENRAYHAWQAMLAHYSCLTRVGQPTTVVVHDGDGSWPGDFQPIARTGGCVMRARSYAKQPGGFSYPPRNAAGSLLGIAEVLEPDDVVVLCDPDFVFQDRPRFPAGLAAATYTYLDYTAPPVVAAAARLGVTPSDIASRGDHLLCGPPYAVPAGSAADLARGWLDAVDAFVEPRWWDMMHAFGLAVVRLDLSLTRAPLADCNYWPDEPPVAPIIHYCYDNPEWSKRNYQRGDDPARVWGSGTAARRGTILGAVLEQIHEAGEYYGRLRAES